MSDCGNVKKVFVKDKKESSQIDLSEPIKGVKITDVAAEKIKIFVEAEGHNTTTHGLHIRVVKDGCSGNSYEMEIVLISDSLEKQDKIFEYNGSTVMIEKTSYFFVTGSYLDFVEALTGSGFTLKNPNIKRSCSCGSSFAV